MSCEMCTDQDGVVCFPLHGLAPHRHTATGIEFNLAPVDGFTPDADDQTQGTWWCPYCGDGKPDTPHAEVHTPASAVSVEPIVEHDGD